MGCTDGIDMEFFHLLQIIENIFFGHAPAVEGMGVMMVDPFEFHGDAVDEKFILRGNANGAKTEFLADDFPLIFQNKGIQIGLFRIPQYGIFHRKGHGFFAISGGQKCFPVKQ